jgi:hypothetical protein
LDTINDYRSKGRSILVEPIDGRRCRRIRRPYAEDQARLPVAWQLSVPTARPWSSGKPLQREPQWTYLKPRTSLRRDRHDRQWSTLPSERRRFQRAERHAARGGARQRRSAGRRSSRFHARAEHPGRSPPLPDDPRRRHLLRLPLPRRPAQGAPRWPRLSHRSPRRHRHMYVVARGPRSIPPRRYAG